MTNKLRDFVGAAEVAADYAYNTVRLAEPFSRLFIEAGQDEPTQAYLADRWARPSVAAMGIGAAGCYDMLHPKSSAGYDRIARHKAVIDGALTMLSLNIGDDVIDERSGTDEEKAAFFGDICRLLYGATPATDPELLRSDPEKAAAVDIATLVSRRIAKPPERAAANLLAMQRVGEQAVPEFEAQLTERDPQRLLELVIRLGVVCYDTVQVHAEIASPGLDEDAVAPVREAGRHLGSYAHVLDHYHERYDDLRNGTNTYATAMIDAEGDIPRVHRAIRELCYDTANDLYAQGRSLLTTEQAVVYRGLRLLLDAEFSPIRRLTRLKGTKRPPVATTVNPAA
jgi:hypothetical protein